MAYAMGRMREAAFHLTPGWTEYVLAQCTLLPTVRGQFDEFVDGDRVDYVCEVFRRDLFDFVWRFLSMGRIVMVKQSCSTDEEDAHSSYFISVVEFGFMCNNSTDPEAADMRLSQEVNMNPKWGWNQTTHQGLPLEGRRRAVFLCLALKRAGLPSLCSMVVLQMCERNEFGNGMLHILPLYHDEPFDGLINMEEEFRISVHTIRPEPGHSQAITRSPVWRP
jgi:hypothetical protein